MTLEFCWFKDGDDVDDVDDDGDEVDEPGFLFLARFFDAVGDWLGELVVVFEWFEFTDDVDDDEFGPFYNPTI